MEQKELNIQDMIGRATVFRKEKKFDEAINLLSTGIQVLPFEGILYRHRGHAYLNKGEFDKGAADFEIATRLIPQNWDVWYHLGVCQYLLRCYPIAEAAFIRSVELATDDDYLTGATAWLWSTYVRQEKVEAAYELANNYPTNPKLSDEADGYAQRIQVYRDEVDAEKVAAVAATRDDHMYATTMYGIALYHELNNNQAEALSIYQTITDRDSFWFGFAEHAAKVRLNEMKKEKV